MPALQLIENNLPQSSSLLRIYCFGVFRVIRRGETEVLGMTSKHKMWSLFKYLINCKGMAICTQEIINLFWPGNQNSDDTATLRTTISRLKSILEPQSTTYQKSSFLIYSKDTCTFNINSSFWLDTDEFERLCGAAHKLGSTMRKMAIDFYFQALELYCGEFLAEDSDYEWTIVPRGHYQRLFLDSSRELACWLVEMKDFPRAAGVLQKALKLEPYAEELQLLLMKVWIGIGDFQAATKHYSECSSRLFRDLGVKPSAEWKLLYQQVKEVQGTAAYRMILEGNLGPVEIDSGPMVCDPESFWCFLLYERRRITRNGGESSLVVLELNSGEDNTNEISGEALEKLESVIYQRLRKSDLFCRLDNRHLALLLHNTGLEGSKIAVAQINRYFFKDPKYSGLKLQVKVKWVTGKS